MDIPVGVSELSTDPVCQDKCPSMYMSFLAPKPQELLKYWAVENQSLSYSGASLQTKGMI